MNYIDKLCKKVEVYNKRYSNKHKKVAIKLIFWNLIQLIRFNKKYQNNTPEVANKIALYFSGGMGDILIGLNYAYYLLKYFSESNINIDIYVKNSDMVKTLDGNSIFKIYSVDHIEDKPYLLKIMLVRFPQIIEDNIIISKQRKNSKLLELTKIYKKFYSQNKRFFEYLPYMDGLTNQFSIINGKKRIQQADIGNLLKIDQDFKYKPKISHEKRILNNLNLTVGRYITINRGVDNSGNVIESTKLWSLSNYNELVKLIKQTYSDYKIVQLGASIDRCLFINNTDVNLVGETSIDSLKVLLKNSALHIDSEGGMVHLRKALDGGVSIVLFGPTSPEFYGYYDNVNIYTKACAMNCEWINETWNMHCINQLNEHVCMNTIKPLAVFEQVKQILEKNKERISQ